MTTDGSIIAAGCDVICDVICDTGKAVWDTEATCGNTAAPSVAKEDNKIICHIKIIMIISNRKKSTI